MLTLFNRKKQYKGQLGIWGLHKNVSTHEMEKMVEELERTDPKLLSEPHSDRPIEFGDHLVRLSKVKRYLRRRPSPYRRPCVSTPMSPSLSVSSMGSAGGFRTVDLSMTPLPPLIQPSSTVKLRDQDVSKLACASRQNDSYASDKDAKSMTSKLFACPYSKYDTVRYSASNTTELAYRTCATAVLRSIPHVKQHLYRVHKRPEYFCPNCNHVVDDAEKLSFHISRNDCMISEQKFEEKMTPEQFGKIKRRQRNADAVQSWYEMWDVLFPNKARTTSPYSEEDSHQSSIQHLVNIFKAIGTCEAQKLYNLTLGEDSPDHLCQPIPTMTQVVLYEAFRIWQNYAIEFNNEHNDSIAVMSDCLSNASTRQGSMADGYYADPMVSAPEPWTPMWQQEQYVMPSTDPYSPLQQGWIFLEDTEGDLTFPPVDFS